MDYQTTHENAQNVYESLVLGDEMFQNTALLGYTFPSASSFLLVLGHSDGEEAKLWSEHTSRAGSRLANALSVGRVQSVSPVPPCMFPLIPCSAKALEHTFPSLVPGWLMT